MNQTIRNYLSVILFIAAIAICGVCKLAGVKDIVVGLFFMLIGSSILTIGAFMAPHFQKVDKQCHLWGCVLITFVMGMIGIMQGEVYLFVGIGLSLILLLLKEGIDWLSKIFKWTFYSGTPEIGDICSGVYGIAVGVAWTWVIAFIISIIK